MDKDVKTGKSTNTLKLILRSASIFFSQNPGIAKSSEASQSRPSRRCRFRRAIPGLATPRRKFGKKTDSESESEPNSPRVSCVGKVEMKGERKKKKAKRKKIGCEDDTERSEWMWVRNIRKMRKTTMELEIGSTEKGAQGSGETAPCLNQMKKQFASGRGSSLCKFEWDQSSVV